MPSSPERNRWGTLLILDTGPIRELVLFHAVDQFRFERLRSELQFIKDPDSYERCTKFIATFRRKATSASVVAELNYWIRQTDRTGQGRLWSRVYEEFRGMGMDEEVVRLIDMELDFVERLGPVDVSLFELARRHVEHNPLVLTIDSRLCDECRQARIAVSLIQEVTFSR